MTESIAALSFVISISLGSYKVARRADRLTGPQEIEDIMFLLSTCADHNKNPQGCRFLFLENRDGADSG